MIDLGSIGFGLAFELKNNFSQEASRLQSEMQGLAKTAKDLETSMGAMKFGGAMAGAGIALLAPLKEAVSVSMDFNKAISEVGAIANASAEDLKRLKQQAMDLGASTAFTAKQVAEGQKFLSMAGFTTNETLTAMPSLLELAAASQMDLGKASDIASNLMSMFGMKADELSRINDVLAKTASRSNVSITQIAESMKYMGPVANALSVPIEEVSAMIGILGDNGLQGGVATRTVASALQRFAKPAKEMVVMMKELNIEMFNSQGKFVGLAGMIEQVEKATRGMTDEQKLNVAATLFGKEASKNFLTLLNASKTVMTEHGEATLKGSQAIRGFKEELDRAGGVAGEMARRQLDNLAGDVTTYESAIEGLLITLGDKLEPILRPLVQFASEMLSTITKFLNTGIGRAVIYIMGAIGVLLTALGTLKMAGVALNFIVPLLRAIAISALSSLLPLLPYVSIAVVIGGAIYYLKKAFDEFDSFLNAASKRGTGFLLFLQRLGGVMKAVWQIITSWDGKTFNLGGMEGKLKELGLLDFVLNLGTWLVRGIEMFKSFFNTLLEIFNSVKKVVIGVYNAIKSAIGPVIKKIFEFIPFIDKTTSGLNEWQQVGKILAYVFATGLVMAIVAVTIAFWNMAVAVIAATWPILLIIGIILGIIWVFTHWSEVVNWFAGLWTQFTNYLVDVWNSFVEWLFGLPERFVQWGIRLINSIKQGIMDAWESFKAWFLGKIMEIPGISMILEAIGVDTSGVNANNSPDISSNMAVVASQKAMQYAGASTSVNVNVPNPETPQIVLQNILDGEVITNVVNKKNENNRNRR